MEELKLERLSDNPNFQMCLEAKLGADYQFGNDQQVVDKLQTELTEIKKRTWCSYCGFEITIDDDVATKISEHIRTCTKHPLYKALSEISRLEAEKKEMIEEVAPHLTISYNSKESDWWQAFKAKYLKSQKEKANR
jgi:hypothetical protein